MPTYAAGCLYAREVGAMKWLKDILFPKDPVEYLLKDWCKGKTNQELLDKLKNGLVSVGSGNMIILELIERLVNEVEKKK